MLHLLLDILRNSILITGLVIVMMMLIEALDLESRGSFFGGLKKSRPGQVVLSSLLGLIPGCIGGFAAVSLYTGGILSFGALTAMMVASCGDEAFMIIAMTPEKALPLFALLLAIAIISGLAVDTVFSKLKIKDFRRTRPKAERPAGHTCGHHRTATGNTGRERTLSLKRILIFAGVVIFIAALVSGILDHGHAPASGTGTAIDFLGEKWMQYLFAALGAVVLVFLVFAPDHFVDEHLWHHIVKKHLPVIFCWTAGILLLVELGLRQMDISSWISGNTGLMILLAAAIGLIPESGPHLIFVTLYASGIVPFPVLLASCISQDGHSSLPLLAESKKSFAIAKLLNFAVALAAGYASMLLA